MNLTVVIMGAAVLAGMVLALLVLAWSDRRQRTKERGW